LANQFIYGRPVKGDEFLGYEAELQAIFNRLQQGDSSAVIGDPHVGKTSLLIQLENPSIQKKYLGEEATRKFIFKYLDLLAIDDEYSPEMFWSEVLSPIKKINLNSVKKQIGVCEEKKYYGVELERLFSLLNKNNYLLVLTLDEFERLLRHKNFQTPSFYGLLRSLSTRVGGISLIIASRFSMSKLIEKGKSILDVGSPFFQMAGFSLPPFGFDTILSLLDRANPQFSRLEKNFIYRVAGANPYLLQGMAATMLESPRTGSIGEIEKISETFYSRTSHHFDDIWTTLDDPTRTVAVILTLKDLDGRALGSGYNYAEIERVDRFGIELQHLKQHGLAEPVEKSTKGWIFDMDYLLVWRGEKWAISSQAFSWWILRNIIAHDRQIPSVEEWLKQHKYIGVITQKQWDDVKSLFQKMPAWAIRGIAGLARSLWEEISGK